MQPDEKYIPVDFKYTPNSWANLLQSALSDRSNLLKLAGASVLSRHLTAGVYAWNITHNNEWRMLNKNENLGISMASLLTIELGDLIYRASDKKNVIDIRKEIGNLTDNIMFEISKQRFFGEMGLPGNLMEEVTKQQLFNTKNSEPKYAPDEDWRLGNDNANSSGSEESTDIQDKPGKTLETTSLPPNNDIQTLNEANRIETRTEPNVSSTKPFDYVDLSLLNGVYYSTGRADINYNVKAYYGDGTEVKKYIWSFDNI